MKRYNIIIVLFIITGIMSCEDYLDKSPELGITGEEVFTEYYSYRAAVDRGNFLMMNYVHQNTNWAAYIGALSDEQQAANAASPSYKTINQGLWQDSQWRDFGMKFRDEQANGADPYYNGPAGKSLKAVRAMGLCIENIDQLSDFPAEAGYTSEELKDQLLGQAYALRAFHWWEVIRRYGPILLVDTAGGVRKPFSTAYNFDQVRPTWQRCADLMAADCDEAAKLLPSRWETSVDIGRLTKASALALKGMIYMYAASPLMNTEDGVYPYGQDFYSEEYAKLGIQAMVDALAEINTGNTRYDLYSAEDYMENWMSANGAMSKEALLQPPSNNGRKWQVPRNGKSGEGWFLPQHDGGWAHFNVPTQNSVDKFETINGYPVNDFQSDDPAFDPADPYSNRDPRLKLLVFCPGDAMYLSDPADAPMTNEAWSNPGNEGWHYDFYRGKSLVYTGYFDAGKWRKLGYNIFDNYWNQNNYRSFPFIRVADMYLGIAELANEVYGPTGAIPEAAAAGIDVVTAEEALNKIRQRIGMSVVRSEYTASADLFRERVRNERAVEFYGEFRRWYDIRRWRAAKDIFKEGIYGVDVTRNADNTFSYVSKKLDVPRVFEDKHYWYPIENEFVDMFATFEQNPGW